MPDAARSWRYAGTATRDDLLKLIGSPPGNSGGWGGWGVGGRRPFRPPISRRPVHFPGEKPSPLAGTPHGRKDPRAGNMSRARVALCGPQSDSRPTTTTPAATAPTGSSDLWRG